jgi:hypothetical protein
MGDLEEWSAVLAWNNPFNLYAPISGRTTPAESVVSLMVWSSIPVASYGVGYLVVGAEASAGVSYFNIGSALGLSAFSVGWVFAAVSAAAMVYDVHTDPTREAALQKGLKDPGSNADIMKMMSWGSVV